MCTTMTLINQTAMSEDLRDALLRKVPRNRLICQPCRCNSSTEIQVSTELTYTKTLVRRGQTYLGSPIT